MALYRKISPRMYGDSRFCELSAPCPNAQTLWIYLLTGPHTTPIPGVISMGELALSEALGWPLEGFREAFAEVFAKGMVLADWKKRLIFIPNSVKYNPPESPNVIRSWRGFWELIPECNLKDDIQQQLKAFAEGLGEGFAKALSEVLGEDYGESGAGTGTVPAEHQEQEQQQESPPQERAHQNKKSSRALEIAKKMTQRLDRGK